MRDLDQLADSLHRARRELAIAVARNDHDAASTLRSVICQIEQMITAASVDRHESEGM